MNYPFRNSSLPIEERLSDLLGRLTTEEKINMLYEELERLELFLTTYENE